MKKNSKLLMMTMAQAKIQRFQLQNDMLEITFSRTFAQSSSLCEGL